MENSRLMNVEAKLAQTPEDSRLWLEKGLALVEMGRLYEAVEAYSSGIIHDSTDPELYMSRGRRYISLKRFQESLADLANASRMQPGSFDNWYYQGVAHTITGNCLNAEKCFENCLAHVLEHEQISITPVVAWLWLVYMRLGKKEEAQKALEHVTEDTPALPQSPSYKRIVLLYKGILAPETFIDEEQYTNRNDAMIAGNITEIYRLSDYYYINGNIPKSNELLLKLNQIEKFRHAFAFMLAENDMRLRGL